MMSRDELKNEMVSAPESPPIPPPRSPSTPSLPREGEKKAENENSGTSDDDGEMGLEDVDLGVERAARGVALLGRRERWKRVIAWQPPHTRWDEENPPKFTIWINLLFGFAGCFTVSNLYYNQAILNRIAESFAVSFERASVVATLMQAGYASGLLLICPLGDVFPRRPFILCLVFLTALLWIVLCLTNNFTAFIVVSYICGATTVTPQLMLPLVGDLAPKERRASCLAIVVSGLGLGVLVARILGGVMANYTEWRGIYWFGLGVQGVVWVGLYFWMPDYPSKNPTALKGVTGYGRLLWGIVVLMVTEPLLCQASIVAFCLSAVFTSYWTTLSFLLSSPPYEYSSMVIGLFGLIGVVVILLAPVYSRMVIDKVQPLFSAVLGLGLELAGVVVGTFTGGFTVAGPVIQAITIDLGSQFTQIGNRAAIYGLRPDAQNRVNTAYMVAAFSGQLTGTAVGNRLFAQGGWIWSGSCSIGLLVFAIVACLARGPRETGWIGWAGGWAIRRDDLPARKTRDEEAVVEKEALDSMSGSR
ncbi:major facilitator superfamily domain-containing protein [Triangularia setosa]|uniref:Major facilitator superfamily domain-containing protein n=1 Tax=Triangularia setosa TaxID=2587417 RepID=A0AAN7A4G8_9PEZI|nr:major facilitator superfamily domain-containing protein [Podospora setosa]